jgi:molybdate transport system substrate-binding protein
MRRAPSVLLLGAAALAAMVTSCSGDAGGGDRVTLEVFAASSLTDAMWEIGEAYRETHPNTTLRFNFAGSASLVAQVNEGAPADVLVPADLQSAERLDAGIVGTSEVLTTNTLTIIVERGNPQSIDSLDDLARPGLAVVLAAPDVPIGKYAQEVLDKAGTRRGRRRHRVHHRRDCSGRHCSGCGDPGATERAGHLCGGGATGGRAPR